MRLKDCHNFHDFRTLAKRRLPGPIFNYIDGAADDEVTYRRNSDSFDQVDLLPKVLRGTDEIDLSVDGLVDAAAVAKVEAALNAIPGVLEAHANPATDTAKVVFAAGAVALSAITAAVNATGYSAEVKSGGSLDLEAKKAAETTRLGRMTLLAAILTLPENDLRDMLADLSDYVVARIN